MSITIELPAEIENKVMSLAAAEGTSAAAILTQLAINVFGSSTGDTEDVEDANDPKTGAEIAAAALDFEAGYARGERGLTVDEVTSSLDTLFAKRASQRQQRKAA